MERNEILEKVSEVVLEWQTAQTEPGIYKILYDPDTETVYLASTFSGDNSYIPGDNRVVLAYADIRERISLADLGLDEVTGDFIESDTLQAILDEAERRLDAAEGEEWVIGL